VLDQSIVDSKFRLVLLAAWRAKQIINGSKKRVNIKAENPLTIALEEIRQGLINFEILTEERLEEKKSAEESLNINEDAEESIKEEKKEELEAKAE